MRKGTRRCFLQKAGIASAGFLAVAPTSVNAEEAKPNAEEVGVEDEVQALLNEGETSEAMEILSEAGVPHEADQTVAVHEKDANASSDDTPSVTPSAAYNKQKSKLSLSSYSASGYRKYGVTLHWELSNGRLGIDGAGPKDAVGITYSDAFWEPVAGQQSGSNQVSNIVPTADGVKGKSNDPAVTEPSSHKSGHLRTKLQRQDGRSHNVYGRYIHTWNPGGAPGSLKNISISVGNLSVNLGGAADKWKQPAATINI